MPSDNASGTPSADTTAACATYGTRAVKSLMSQFRSCRYMRLIVRFLLLHGATDPARSPPSGFRAGTRLDDYGPDPATAAAPGGWMSPARPTLARVPARVLARCGRRRTGAGG